MSRSCRVLSIVNTLVHGGDENRLLSLATHVNRSRVEHHVAVMKRAHPNLDRRDGTLRPRFAEREISLIELDEPRFDRGARVNLLRRLDRTALSFARTVRKTARLIEELDIDVVEGHVGSANHVAVAAAHLSGRPSLVTTYFAEFFHPRWLSYPLEQVMLRRATVIVTDSHERAAAIRGFLRGAQPRIVLIANGVAPAMPTRPAADVRRELNIPDDPSTVIIGQIAGLVESKGWLVFLEAARRVLALQPHAFFLCIGFEREDRTFRARMEQRARDLGIEDRLRIIGYNGSIGDIWQLIDIHAHASLFDSLPNAIIEGMSVAKPSVVTAVGDLSTLVDHGASGFVVPANNAQAFAHALDALIADPALRRRFGDVAQARYRERFEATVMTHSLEDLFLSLRSSR